MKEENVDRQSKELRLDSNQFIEFAVPKSSAETLLCRTWQTKYIVAPLSILLTMIIDEYAQALDTWNATAHMMSPSHLARFNNHLSTFAQPVYNNHRRRQRAL